MLKYCRLTTDERASAAVCLCVCVGDVCNRRIDVALAEAVILDMAAICGTSLNWYFQKRHILQVITSLRACSPVLACLSQQPHRDGEQAVFPRQKSAIYGWLHR